MTRVAARGTSVNFSRICWGTGVKSESVSSGNSRMAAAFLFSGGILVKNKKNKGLQY